MPIHCVYLTVQRMYVCVCREEWLQKRQERVYIVKAGDNLSTIAEQFRVPLPAILIWNRINLNRPIHPGDRLVIYPSVEEADKR